jgi:hypothetical protein
MSDTWKAESPPHYDKSNRLARTMNYLLGDRFPGLQTNTENYFSLYMWLLAHIGESAEALAPRITQNGEPMFHVADLTNILKIVKSQQSSKVGQYLKSQRCSGGAVPVATPVASTGPAPKGVPVSPLDADPSRSKFFDKFIRKISHPISSQIPPSWDGVLWYFFILYNLEQMEFIGPMIGTALDTITLSLPVVADLASELTEKLVSLAPIPYANFAGEALGYAISLIFISIAVVLNGSRKHFGSGFKVSLEAVPVFGDILMDAAQSVETGADRYLSSRAKLLRDVDKISPHAEDFLDYYTPDTKIHNEAPPTLDMPSIKQNVVEYVVKETGIDDAMDSISDPVAALTGAVNNAKKAAENKVTGAVNNAKKAAENKVTGAVNNAKKAAENKITGAVNNTKKAAENKVKKGGFTRLRTRTRKHARHYVR